MTACAAADKFSLRLDRSLRGRSEATPGHEALSVDVQSTKRCLNGTDTALRQV